MEVKVELKQATKATGKRFFSKQKCIIIGTAIFIILIALMIVTFNLISGKKFNSDNAGREVRIGWEEVNLRAGYSTSNEIITTLSKGSSVTLTGNSYEYLMGNGLSTDSWTEVQLENGTTGWVVTTSIKRI